MGVLSIYLGDFCVSCDAWWWILLENGGVVVEQCKVSKMYVWKRKGNYRDGYMNEKGCSKYRVNVDSTIVVEY